VEGIHSGQIKGMVHLPRGADIVVVNPSQYSWSLGKDMNSGPLKYGATYLSITLS
jgi:hypothetical protein